MMFAMGEAIAHLNRLEQAGRLVRTQGEDGVIRYIRASGNLAGSLTSEGIRNVAAKQH
jgi:hypothetical protein